jgi:hypothetical protein
VDEDMTRGIEADTDETELKIRTWYLSPLILIATAFIVRMIALFLVTPVDFRWESYHYWQIAFYTLHVGISHGRMWDLGGMEYFWGPLPILAQSFLLYVLGTASELPFRVLNGIIGSVTVYLVYIVTKRHFNGTAGLLAAVMVMLFPLLVFNSVIGMEETIGAFFIMAALNFFDRRNFLFGFFLGLASLSRIEFWPLSIGLCVSYLIFGKNSTGLVESIMGWLTPMVPYFIHVRGTTGSPFYAFYWNFIGNIAGVWTPWYVDPIVRTLFGAVLVGSLAGLLVLFKYRGKVQGYMLYALFLGFLAYHGLTYVLGGSAPLFDRLFVLDATVGFILAGRYVARASHTKALGAAICILVASSMVYAAPYYMGLQLDILGLYKIADAVGPAYTGGTILCDMPMITYRLVDHWHISYERILGTLYMPLEDLEGALSWLKSNNASWIVVAEPKAQKVIAFFHEKLEDKFDTLFTLYYSFSGAELYRVDEAYVEEILGA